MSAKPDKTLVTAQDVIEYLWSLLYKKRSCRIENDFQFGYDRALNEVMYRLMFASECCTCAGGALEDQTMTVLDVLDDLFDAIQGMKNRLPENDFEKGFDSAIYVLMYQVWSASPEWEKSQFALPEIQKDATRARRSSIWLTRAATWKPRLVKGRMRHRYPTVS